MVPDWQPVFGKDPCTIRGTINADHPGHGRAERICGLGGRRHRGLRRERPAPGRRRGRRLNGGPGQDVLLGGNGADSLDGGAGDDHLDSGPGADNLVGGPGRDTVAAGSGDDCLAVQDGARDVVDGGAGSDNALTDRVDALTHVERTFGKWPKKNSPCF